jgi:hypothetical protein
LANGILLVPFTASAQGCAAGWHRRSERRIQLDQDLIGLSLISNVIFFPLARTIPSLAFGSCETTFD